MIHSFIYSRAPCYFNLFVVCSACSTLVLIQLLLDYFQISNKHRILRSNTQQRVQLILIRVSMVQRLLERGAYLRPELILENTVSKRLFKGCRGTQESAYCRKFWDLWHTEHYSRPGTVVDRTLQEDWVLQEIGH